ncbi:MULTISPECIES: PEP-CTERM sorting domain-containing protein [unclassified Lentimonas]|uniref:PEP-CTERM sorting domain-containing protein n=1 Tax=unclassified Lentimonas TaxID=2630993 RepID=UPI00132B2C28|nr:MULTISPECIES: PEP-CTERM sorting domain-containing protein [unclassified Lentimonas]CAA6689438.1 Unannotated [Lentimonas sp. CC10]CAA6696411.1 Unannotated [Lentimonas sp. CC19]CAA7070503.1 Unannotated [Lentimonas sp. CC11]
MNKLQEILTFTAPFALAASLNAQLAFDGTNDAVVTFDATTAGVTNDQYAGAGRSSNPSAGQLDSEFYAQLKQGFDGGNASNAAARGVTTGTTGPSAGNGFYAADINNDGNRSFAYQAGNDNLEAFDFRITSSAALTAFDISFDAQYFKLTSGRVTGLNFSYAIDAGGDAITDAEVNALSFTANTDLNIAGTLGATANVWNDLGNLSTTISASVAAGDAIILRFEGITIEGAGGSRTFNSVDNLKISAVPEPGTYALLAGMCALSAVALRRRQS